MTACRWIGDDLDAGEMPVPHFPAGACFVPLCPHRNTRVQQPEENTGLRARTGCDLYDLEAVHTAWAALRPTAGWLQRKKR